MIGARPGPDRRSAAVSAARARRRVRRLHRRSRRPRAARCSRPARRGSSASIATSTRWRRARETLAPWRDRVELVHADYRALDAVLDRRGVPLVDGALADLGVSSMQFDAPGRGFSFQRDEPLDMRMDRSGGDDGGRSRRARRAKRELADAIFQYGEERFSRRIARAIVEARREAPIETTGRLAAIVRRAIPRRGFMRIDPATRTFQALRIWVNRELDGLDRFLEAAARRLRAGRAAGRDHVSLARGSDREAHVPRARSSATAALKVLTKKPVVPTDEEVRAQPARAQRQAAGRRTCVGARTGDAGRDQRITMEPFEYAIKKDVRNNPIVREVDEARQRELWKSVGVAGAPGAGAAVLGVAALRAAAPRLPARGAAAASARRRRRSAATCGSRSRRCARRSGSRRWRPSSCTWWRPSRDDAIVIERVRAGRAAGAIGGRAPVTASANRVPSATPARTGDAAAREPAPTGGRAEAAHRRRRRVLGLWVAGIEARLVYLQVFAARRSGGARRAAADAAPCRRRPSAATSSIAAAACSPPASTPTRSTPCRRKSPTPATAVGEAVRRARATATAKERQALDRSACAAAARSPTCGGRSRPIRSARVAALNLDGIGFIKESRRFYPEQGAGGAPARLRRHRQQRAERPRSGLRLADSRQGRHDARPDRRAAPRLQPLRAAADGRLDASS